MTLPAWQEELIAKKHDRAGFDCGQGALNIFLRQHARQSHENGASKTYVASVVGDGKTVLGYDTLGPAQIDFHRVREVARLDLGRHDVGRFCPARLGVARLLHGRRHSHDDRCQG